MTTTSDSSLRDIRSFREFLNHPDMPRVTLWLATLSLLGFGIVMVDSASFITSMNQNDGNGYALVFRQAEYAAIGVLIMWGISKVSSWRLMRLSRLVLAGTAFMLVVVLFIGEEVYGQKNWIQIAGPVRIQPSEFAKFALVLWTAAFIAENWERRTEFGPFIGRIFLVWSIALGLIVLEGDMGNPMVIAPVLMALLFVLGVPVRWLVIMFVAGVAAIGVFSAMKPYRWLRIQSWLDPSIDPQGIGYQVTHGMRALGSGGWFGVGLGASREKWGALPAAHTDFIYAIIGEELGLAGTFGVLFSFLMITLAAIKIAHNTNDVFIKFATVGITAWLLTQLFINIGAVIRLLPITGVTIPLVSYGGSSLIPTLAGIGLLLCFAREESAELSE